MTIDIQNQNDPPGLGRGVRYFMGENLNVVWSELSALSWPVPGSAKANGREPKNSLGRVFNFKLGHFVTYAMAWHIQKQALA